jgi:hypothetical protein
VRDDLSDGLELRASQQLVSTIDVLLALVLVEGAVFYRQIFASPSSANAPVLLAMALIYYTAVRSFIDWHAAMEASRYRILTNGHRDAELGRVFLDFAIMASYSFLLLRAHVLIADPGADLLAIAITYPAIYVLYIAWGLLLCRADPTTAYRFSRRLLLVTAALAGALLLCYVVARQNGWLGSDGQVLNAGLLVLELLIVVWYRRMNWRQQIVLLP